MDKREFIIMQKAFQFLLLLLATTIFSVAIQSCAYRSPMNDFFGIQMEPEQIDNFQIIEFNPQQGIKYANAPDMNPRLYGWAELLVTAIKIKVTNKTQSPVEYDYYIDAFSITSKDGKTYGLDKGRLEDYPPFDVIEPGESVEFLTSLPENYWDIINMRQSSPGAPSITNQFWKGENSLSFTKKDIALITVHLSGGATIVLKPTPAP